MERLLQQTAKSYPNVTIRVATTKKHPLASNIPQVFVDLLDMNDEKMSQHQFLKRRKDGFIWQRLINQVNTPYVFAAIDLLYVDPKDVNLVRMVSEFPR